MKRFNVTGNCIPSKHYNEGSHNSPWNIAADFNIDMSFNPTEIASMLIDYEKENNCSMEGNSL